MPGRFHQGDRLSCHASAAINRKPGTLDKFLPPACRSSPVAPLLERTVEQVAAHLVAHLSGQSRYPGIHLLRRHLVRIITEQPGYAPRGFRLPTNPAQGGDRRLAPAHQLLSVARAFWGLMPKRAIPSRCGDCRAPPAHPPAHGSQGRSTFSHFSSSAITVPRPAWSGHRTVNTDYDRPR